MSRNALVCCLRTACLFIVLMGRSHSQDPFGIQIVDEETGRGVPLAKLTTTGAIEYWTDNQGWIAFDEPGLMNQEVYFSFDSPGYSYKADGFGYRGATFRCVAGQLVTWKVKRTNQAERLYRITGQGLYRDSERLKQPIPTGMKQINAGVIGSDSVQMVPYRGGLFWLWGDTNLPNYPLGNFHVTAARSKGPEDVRIEKGIPLEYFADAKTGRARQMMPTEGKGAVWLWGLVNLEDATGQEELIAHYSRHIKLGEMVEHGMAAWNPAKEVFEMQVQFDLANTWQHARGQAVRYRNAEGDFIYFAEPFATTRVPARREDLFNPDRYEALAWNAESQTYVWQSKREPVTQAAERQASKAGVIPVDKLLMQVVDRYDGKPVEMHRGSIQWNAYRKRWILIACEANRSGNPSLLGEIWYAEAPSIEGPWVNAMKIASHPKYSFYNPRHHVMFDEDGGKVIYFEGTYTNTFSGNPSATPRYDYNQIVYRLDLSRLELP
jgi:hypothetical protein